MRKTVVYSSIVLIFCLLLTASWGRGLSSQPPKKVGVLLASDLRLIKADGLREGLRHFGLADGQNVTILVRSAQDDFSQLPHLANELIAQQVDVLVTAGTFETFAAKEAVGTRKIPIVFVNVGCSEEIGLVSNPPNLGCNITGIDSNYVQLSGKRLEYLKRLVPDLRQVAVLYNPLTTPIGPSARYLYEAATKLNVKLKLIPTANREQLLQALDTLAPEETDAVMLMCSLLFESMTEPLAKWSIQQKIPIMGVSEQQTEQGLLASYGLPYKEEGRQAAHIVSNILRNQDPASIPVESPASLEFYLNRTTANQLGLSTDSTSLPFITKYIGSTASDENVQ